MRAIVLGLTVLASIGADRAMGASQPGTQRRIVGTSGESNQSPDGGVAEERVPPRSIYSCQPMFAIPFTLDRAEVNSQDVLLFVSADSGRNWRLYGRQPAAQSRFVFRANGDGDYWFASRTTAPGMPAPAAASYRPELSVVVDTADPRLDLQAAVEPGGKVKIAWDATDQNLAPETFKLEYQSGFSSSWRPIPIPSSNEGVVHTTLRGQTDWQPDKSDRIVNIRAVVQDKAENSSEMTRRLIIPLTLANRSRDQRTMSASSVPRDPFAQYGMDSDTSRDYQTQLDTHDTARETEYGVQREQDNDDGPPAVRTEAETDAEGVAWPTDDEQDTTSQWRNDYPPSKSPVGPPVARDVSAGRDTSADTPSRRSHGGRHSSETESDGVAGLPQGEQPHMTRSKRFNLDYSIDAVGPLGVEKVELWVTRDGGRNWDLWGLDEDRESPFLVSIDEEGIYGFRIVIVGRNGLASETPRAGDLADLWVGVDTTKPDADVTSAAYGSGAFAGHLDVRWTATDDHLGAKPITLLISEKRNGPWTPIASGLPNTGQYRWRVDSRVPDRFYLRLEVQDEAGNVTTCDLDKPIKSAGLTPKGRVRGIEPFGM